MADVTPGDVVLTTSRVGAATITLIQPGAPGAQGHVAVAGSADLGAPEIRATATVTLRGAPGEDVGLWRFGFIQLKFITDEWAHYRGMTPADGSVFVAMDRPPARPKQLCRDTAEEIGLIDRIKGFPYTDTLFYYPNEALTGARGEEITGVLPRGTQIPASGKLSFTLTYSDSPGRRSAIEVTRVNNKAQKLNNLYSLYSGNAYATLFAVQKNWKKPIEVLKSFQWNVRWRAPFRYEARASDSPAPTAVRRRNGHEHLSRRERTSK